MFGTKRVEQNEAHNLCLMSCLAKSYCFRNNQIKIMLWVRFRTWILNGQQCLSEHNGDKVKDSKRTESRYGV
jgi:hypothetical protein